MILLFINKFILAGIWTEVLSNLSIRIISWATLLDKLCFLIIKAEGRKKPINRKKPRPNGRGFVFALPIFTASCPATIVGVQVLNFCVRDGNRWTHLTINTNSMTEEVFPFLYIAVSRRSVISRITASGLYQIFPDLSTLFFRNLVTHTGFEPMLTA